MRTKTVSAISLFVAFLFSGGTAFASVSVDSVVVDPEIAIEGQQVTATVTVTKSGSGCNNNVGSLYSYLNDEPLATTTVNSFSGSGVFEFPFVFNAPAHLNYTLKVIVDSGEEDFFNGGASPDCTNTVLGEVTTPLRVDPDEGGGGGHGMSFGGGGGMCSPLTGYPECQTPAHYAFHGIPFTPEAEIMYLQQQVLSLLEQVIALLSQ